MKNNRTSQYENGVAIPTTFNKDIPLNVYKNTNSRLDKPECLFGCTNSGCSRCEKIVEYSDPKTHDIIQIKTEQAAISRMGAPYRAPVAGYRKTLVCYSKNKDVINKPTKTIYRDNYASNKSPKDGYKQFQPQIQNKNGYINSGYSYSTKQLLTRRNRTYEIKQFNFLSKNTPCNP